MATDAVIANGIQMIEQENSDADSPRTKNRLGVMDLCIHAAWFVGFVISAAWLLDLALSMAPRYVQQVSVLALLLFIVVLFLFQTRSEQRRLGVANTLTLFRTAIVCLIVANIGFQWPDLTAWVMIVLSIVALILDGLDGKYARQNNEMSAFGARFDQEIDAGFILGLCFLVVDQGKAGTWIILSGAMRYLFVLASYPLPWLSAPLPDSFRRKLICVLQISALLLCLSPLVDGIFSAIIAAFSLILLGASFAIDIGYLFQRRHHQGADIVYHSD